jgi:hypothetical protein
MIREIDFAAAPVAWVHAHLGRLILPATWTLDTMSLDGARFVVRGPRTVSIIVSGAVELDGKRWLHASIAAPNRLPDYEELVAMKETVFGSEAYAVQVFPPRSKHVNQHPFCLHLFGCIDGHPLPDFTHGGSTL